VSLSLKFDADGVRELQILWEDSERALCRGRRRDAGGGLVSVLIVFPVAEHPPPLALDRLSHEYRLKDELDAAWAVRPLDIVRDGGGTALLLEDPGGEPLEPLLGEPIETGRFLRLAIDIAAALGGAHQRGLVHKDVKPANILVNCADGQARLTGFGIASRLPRERRAAEPPKFIAGTLAYMAPEQTGRMNRSIDSRSDLYALGVTFYQMLTGFLPFSAADPMEWVHCHIARKPVAPSERLEVVPTVVSGIVMKLLAKTAEDRYQTAAGLEHDLRRSLAEWELKGRIDPFTLGEGDRPDRLMIPERLYGREREVKALLAAFDRIVAGGAPELVLVSGYSGIGKSSVVNELHKALVPPRGLFASGKFDQLKRDIPYSTWVQAFQSLVRSLLGKNDAELGSWRVALQEALGLNGRLIAGLIPELTLIVGEQPPVLELEPQQAQGRFQLVFRRFIGVFATAEHPLALFLDDLQWLDVATLDLLEDLLTQADVQNLLLIGAYRDSEVDVAHPLMRKLVAIRSSGAKVSEIKLEPLDREHVGRLIADALGCEPASATPLSELVHAKTDGNPFFVLQFLQPLADEGLLAFDHEAQRWSWDVDRIHAKGYADNVVDLMVGKLARLSDITRRALQELACLGNVADVPTLAAVLGTTEDEVHAALWEAVRLELVERLSGAYRFVHDRVQEAAYSLIPEAQRAAAHLRIGRLLVARTPPEKREDAIFEIVNHPNRGAGLISEPEEREQLADLNLIAGKRAKASTAYASALAYFTAGAAFLPEDSWKRRHDLAFALELGWAECEFLTGALAEAEQRLANLTHRALRVPDLAAVARLREDLFMTLGRSDRAVDVCLDYLRHVDIAWSAHPTKEEVRQEYERIWRQIGSRSIEDLLDLPPMTDPAWRATMDVLTKAVTPARFTDQNLHCVLIGRMVNLSLEHGNSDASCYAYALVGAVLGSEFGDCRASSRFGKLGLDLVEQRGLDRFEAGVYLVLAIDIIPWTQPIRSGRSLIQRAFDAAERLGDRTFAGYSCAIQIFDLIAAGDPLGDVQRETEARLDFVRKRRFGLQVDIIAPPLQFIRTMRGLTPIFGSFNDAEFDEGRFERHLEADPRLAVATCLYWVRKLQARFFANDHSSALAAAARAERLFWTSETFFQLAEYHLYAALARAALCDRACCGERAHYLEALAAHHRQFQKWAANCPENFENRAALLGAEIARLEGRETDAERLYEQAIRSARANGFIHNEAIAYELAARFYETRGFEDFAHVYLRKARDGYLRWGADGKVRQLEEMYPNLRTKEPLPAPTSTIGAPVESLDLATVIKVSQAVSSEIILEKLIDTLMRNAIEQAGAERGLLIALRGDELQIEAEATTSGEDVTVHLPDGAHATAALPESLVRYVVRTQESVILDDASSQNPFSADPYVVQRRARSILCLPLINRAKLVRILLLENNLTWNVFTPDRVTVLKALASQAAISLENSRLYRDLEDREGKIRRLVDSNIIGVFVGDFDGRILGANDAFLQIVGYDREDLTGGRINWKDLTPRDWRDRDARWIEEHKRTGARLPIEKEYFRKDGSRVPILLGSASVEEGGDQSVTFVLDLSQRKQAEEALRESERKLRQFIESVPCHFWSANPDGEATQVNQRLLDYFGIRRLEDQRPSDRYAVLHPDDVPETERALNHAFQTGESFQRVHRLRRSDGEYRWHSVRAEPLRDQSGNIIQWYGFSIDIDEAKKAEDRLRRSEAYLAEAQRLSHTGSFGWTPSTGEFHWSDETFRILEYDPSVKPTIEGVLQRVHPDDLAKVRQVMGEASRGDKVDITHRLLMPDGSIKFLHVLGQASKDAAGNLEIVGAVMDVTENTRLYRDLAEREEALRDSEYELRQIIETVPSLIWSTDPAGEPTQLNQRIFAYSGLRLEDFKRGGWEAFIHPDDFPETIRAFSHAIQTGTSYQTLHRLRRADGEFRWHHARGEPLRDEEGRIIRWYGLAVDISEAKKAEDRLQQLQSDFAHLNRVSVMGELAASLSHEITQPIASARNNARAAQNFLHGQTPDLREVEEALGCVVADADRAGNIVDRIRDHIKKAPPRKALCDLNAAINEVLVLARSAIVQNGVSIQTRLAEGLSPIHGDRVQLQQVVLNLVLNAAEAMSAVDEGTRDLLISTEQSPTSGVLVALRDSGPGIDPKHIERVFEAFYTTKSSGVGMGLSICRSIINAHGGRLWADANEPRGAVFQFTLPSAEGGL
jgi:PAS domain S-box-containing protein